jgi:hypothetical protein
VGLKLVFWGAVGSLAWVYAGYPAVAAMAARRNRIGAAHAGEPPTLAVAIAIHQGAELIEERIADVLAQARDGARITEVIVGDDGSTDGTRQIVERLAVTEPRLRFMALPRAGQTPTQEALFNVATAEVVVLTDAETRFAPGCLARLGEAFTDPRIGCATGKLVWFDAEGSAAASSEGVYWRYELAVRALESRAGWLTAVTGAIVAVRRSAFRPVPARSSMDELLPVYVREQGSQVVFVPDAVAMDRPISSGREQFRTRARISTRGITGTFSVLGRPGIRSQPGPVLAMVSHKLMRWATPWFVLAAAASGLGLLREGPVYALAPLGLVGMTAVGAGAEAAIRRGRRVPRVAAFARSFGIVNLAFALGWVNALRRRRYETWTPAAVDGLAVEASAPDGAGVADGTSTTTGLPGDTSAERSAR